MIYPSLIQCQKSEFWRLYFYSIGHKSETAQPKKIDQENIFLHLSVHFLAQNSQYPLPQKLAQLFDIWAIST